MATYGGFNGFKQAFARERIAVAGVVKTLTQATYDDAASAVDVRRHATGARVTIEGNAMRFTEDGSTPVNTGGSEVGTLGNVGDVIYLDGYAAIKKFQILQSSASGNVEVVYFR